MVNILEHRFVKLPLKFLFSHFGLCILVSTYAICGAFLIRSLEIDNEWANSQMANESAEIIFNETIQLKARITGFVEHCKNVQNNNTSETENEQYPFNCTGGNKVIYHWVNTHHKLIIAEKDKTNGIYVGTLYHPVEIKSWTVASSILFTASILTTIGYGQVAPKTQTGQLVVILYSLLAIPLMSIFLVNFSSLLGDVLFYIYDEACCRPMNKKRAKLHGMLEAKKRPKTLTLDDSGERATTSSVDGYEPNGGRAAIVYDDKRQSIVSNDQPNNDHVDGNGNQTVVELVDEDGILESPEHIPATLAITVAVLVCVFGTMLFSQTEGWGLIPTFYFTFVTLSTMGFGDYIPGWANGREVSAGRMLFLALYAVFGLAVMATVVNISMFTLMDLAQKWIAAIKHQVNTYKQKSLKQI